MPSASEAHPSSVVLSALSFWRCTLVCPAYAEAFIGWLSYFCFGLGHRPHSGPWPGTLGCCFFWSPSPCRSPTATPLVHGVMYVLLQNDTMPPLDDVATGRGRHRTIQGRQRTTPPRDESANHDLVLRPDHWPRSFKAFADEAFVGAFEVFSVKAFIFGRRFIDKRHSSASRCLSTSTLSASPSKRLPTRRSSLEGVC